MRGPRKVWIGGRIAAIWKLRRSFHTLAHVKVPRPIVILGPTAGGKSELAVRLAEMVAALDGKPGQIIGADSMQVYRHMDAGTAKPTPEQRQRVVHHLIDIVEPTERFTVADWL